MACLPRVVLALLVASVPVHARAITYTSALRTISEGIGGEADSTDRFGPWVAEVSGFGCMYETECGGVTVLQASDLAENSISISSSIEGNSDDGPEPNGASTLSASFSLTHSLAFTATGIYFASGSLPLARRHGGRADGQPG